jgi:SAM-dependent methyltransferase
MPVDQGTSESRPAPVTLDPADTRASYDRVAEAYAERFDDELDGKPLDRALLEFLPELAELDRRPGVVADLGSGPGQIGRHVRRCSGLPVVAVDLSPAMASLARSRHGLPAATGSLTSLPLATRSIGAAVAFYCFIHLDDDGMRAAAAELHRVLRPRGVAIVAVHTGDEIRHVETLVDTAVDLDFRFLPVETLERALTDAGLAVEAVLERTGVAGVESETRRAYLVTRRPS